MRSLGLDVGTKTIGIAMSDALGLAAHPLLVLPRAGTVADVAAVEALVSEHSVEAVIVGMPLELSGEMGHRARRVQILIDALAEHFGERLPVHDWDERFSTAAVERVLIDADMSRAKRKKVVDKQAAAYILQGWLDANRASS
ncbi:MAG: Holliday junction resolvase RuvX [Myxococcales bacterium]|nr:Holliday junction resolvase RuvX [Myxococcales bacterium]